MYIILGGTGHVGSSVARTLLKHKQPVTIVTRESKHRAEWEKLGAKLAFADVRDSEGLRQVFRQGKRLFLLNPPADPSTDTAAEETGTVSAILDALVDSGIEKVVAQSTYGAQPGDRLGDMGVLYELEQGLAKTGISATIIRAAYYMSNWESASYTAIGQGRIFTLYPPDFKLPMVAPQDIGQIAAELLMEPTSETGLYHVEGPHQYSSEDVAAAFGIALNKSVEAVEIPQEQWERFLIEAGFSPPAAASMAAMTAVTLARKDEEGKLLRKGTTTLQEYIDQLIQKQD